MKVYTHIEFVWDGERYVPDEENSVWHEYEGPVAECKKDGGDPPAPDPAVGRAALENMELGREWLDFAKQQYGVANDRQAKTDALTNKVVNQQVATQDKSNARADEQWNQYKTVFQPAETKSVEEAMQYDSPEKQAAAAAEARADVARNLDLQRGAQERNMASMGINPTSGRYAGIDRSTSLTGALAQAGAENSARDKTRQMGIMLRKDAAALGRNLPGTAAQSYGVGLQAGNSAVGNNASANTGFYQANNVMTSGFGGAMSGNSSGAGMLNTQYGNQLQGWAAQQQANSASSAGIGNLVGTGIGAYAAFASSKTIKENKEGVDGALDALDSMPVEKWDYKEGEGDGGTHVGPYAEDFRAKTGLGDGKSINVIDAVGVTMKAVQELNKKVDALAGSKKRKEAA